VRRRLASITRRVVTRDVTLSVAGRPLFARCSAGPRSLHEPVVVLVHGLEDSSESLLGAVRALAPDHRVFALDLPGSGRSEGPSEGLDVPALADALAAWLEAMRLSRATVVGSSTGSQVVAQLAARHPERVARIVLDCPTVAPQVRTTSRLLFAWLRNLRHVPLIQTARALRRYVAMGKARTWEILRRVLADHIEDVLPRITVPTLVIHGARDTLAPRRWAGEVTRRLPSGRLYVVPGVAHGVGALAPRALAAAVYHFIRDASHRRAA
jgi:pimeloyl-ACP methyl ester carboxylesterase